MTEHAKASKTAPTPRSLPSAFKLFAPSLEALKVNALTLITLMATPLLLLAPLLLLTIIFGRYDSGWMVVLGAVISLLGGLLYLILCIVVGPALIATQLQGARGKHLRYGQAFKRGISQWLWLRYVGVSVCVGLVVLGGLLLFIVPGLFMLRRYVLAPYYLVDRNLGVFEAMRQSAADSKHFSKAIWGLLGVQLLVAITGIIPFAGVILQLLYLCAPAVRYYEFQDALGRKPGVQAAR
jgi:hypothetical protein